MGERTEKEDREGVLCAGDRVRLVGLTGDSAEDLNAREGYVVCIDGESPYKAQLPGNRYVIDVMIDDNVGERFRVGSYRANPNYKRIKLKRKFLEPITLGLSTDGQGGSGNAGAANARPNSTVFFSVVEKSDLKTLKQLLENMKAKGVKRPADEFLDWAGNTALYCAIECGYSAVVKMLIQFGTNVNYSWGPNMPAMRDADVLPLHLALIVLSASTEKTFSKEKEDPKKLAEREDIVLSLILAGADLSYMSKHKGTPLLLACHLPLFPESRLKLTQLLLDHDADPNQMVVTMSGFQTLPLIAACGERYFGGDEERMELSQMLLDAGADPGTLCRGGKEACNAIHLTAARRNPKVLKVLLESEKGRAAVDIRRRSTETMDMREQNGDCESPLLIVVSEKQLAENNACRECAILLLKAGADPEAKDSLGMKPSMWLHVNKSKKHGELGKLVRAARGKNASFWDSTVVQSFVGGDEGKRQCPVCMVWSDQMRDFTGSSSSGFRMCSRCCRQDYCSRSCQKKHWPTHKKKCSDQPS